MDDWAAVQAELDAMLAVRLDNLALTYGLFKILPPPNAPDTSGREGVGEGRVIIQ